jgi:hypothetical protein
MAWLIMAFVITRSSWQVYRAGLPQTVWLSRLGAGLIAAQAALAIHGLVDAVTWGTRPAVVVWGIWGLALAGCVVVHRDSSDRRPGIWPSHRFVARWNPANIMHMGGA